MAADWPWRWWRPIGADRLGARLVATLVAAACASCGGDGGAGAGDGRAEEDARDGDADLDTISDVDAPPGPDVGGSDGDSATGEPAEEVADDVSAVDSGDGSGQGDVAIVGGEDRPEDQVGACFGVTSLWWPPTRSGARCVSGCGDDVRCVARCTEPVTSRSCSACRDGLRACEEAWCGDACGGSGDDVACGSCVSDACSTDWHACAGRLESYALLPPLPAEERGCGARTDQDAATRPEVAQHLAACATSCSGTVGTSCQRACLVEQAGLTSSCSACFSAYVSCPPTVCYETCVSGWFTDACKGCSGGTCYAELVDCVGYAPDVGWESVSTVGRLRLVNADAGRPIIALVDEAGGPLVRAVDYMRVTDPVEVSTSVRVVQLTDGSFGPVAVVLRRAPLLLLPGASVVAISLRADGGDPSLILYAEPTSPPVQTRFAVMSGYGGAATRVRIVDETDTPTVVGETGFGGVTPPFTVPPGPLRLRFEVDDGPAWLLSLGALPRGVDTLFVLGNAETADGLGVAVVQSTGGGSSTSAIRVR